MSKGKQIVETVVIAVVYVMNVVYSWYSLFKCECGYKPLQHGKYNGLTTYLLLVTIIIVAVINHFKGNKNPKFKDFEVIMNPYIFVLCVSCIIMMSYPWAIILLNRFGADVGVPWQDGNPVVEFIIKKMESNGHTFLYIK